MFRASILTFLLLPIASALPYCEQFMCDATGASFNFEYVIDTTTNTLNATVTAPSTGDNTWLAIGFSQGTVDPMAGGSSTSTFSDMAIGSYDSSTSTYAIRDYYTATKTNPTLDSSQDVHLQAGDACLFNATTQTLTLSFYRLLDTGDAAEDKVIEVGTEFTLLWAYNDYADSITTDGTTLTKHDTTARGYLPDFAFSSGTTGSTCGTCAPQSTSVYDERLAQCISNGWPAVTDGGDFAGDTVTFSARVACSVCTTSRLTDQSLLYVATTIQTALEGSSDDDSIKVSVANATDLAGNAVSVSVTVTASAGSGEDLKEAIVSELEDNNAASLLSALNEGQSATTITAVDLLGSVSVDAGSGAPDVPCLANSDSTWSASWNVTGDVLTVTMSSTAAGPDGWIGIGFQSSQPPVNSMAPGDFYIGSVGGNGVGDYHLAGSSNGAPSADDSDDVTSSSCDYDGSTATLTCTFSRALATGDDTDDVDLDNGAVSVLYAFSSQAFPSIHDTKGSVAEAIDMTEECGGVTASEPIRYLVILHAVLMTVAWLILIPWGAFIARFRTVLQLAQSPTKSTDEELMEEHDDNDIVEVDTVQLENGKPTSAPAAKNKKKGPPAPWFRIHFPVQWIGIVLMIVALILIIVDAGLLTPAVIAASPTSGAHQIVGILVAVLAISQPVFACCRNGIGNVDPKKFHDCWAKFHGIIGLFTLILAFGAMILGSFELSSSSSPAILAGIIIGLLTLVAASIAGAVLGRVRVRKTSENGHTAATSAASTSSAASAFPYVVVAILVVAVVTSITGIVLTELNAGSASGSAAVTDEVTGDYMFCNFMPGYAVTTAETQYYCHSFQFPDVDDQQIINYQVMLDQDRVVHHMILYEATEADPSEGFFDCATMPPGSTPIWAWAPGGDDFTLPDNVGFDTPKYGILQVHYNNPNGIAGLVDRSGVLMNITSTKREYSAAFLITGISTSKISIPPMKTAYGLSDEKTTIPSTFDGVKLFSSALHMHLTGKRIWTRLWRDGEVVLDPKTGTDALGHNDAYDFNFQAFDTRDITVQHGDQLQTTCVYENTVSRGVEFGNPFAAQNKTVTGGEATPNEMCLSFIAYYPKQSGSDFTSPTVVCDDDDAGIVDCADYN